MLLMRVMEVRGSDGIKITTGCCLHAIKYLYSYSKNTLLLLCLCLHATANTDIDIDGTTDWYRTCAQVNLQA
jgi:hypothetical protein